MGIFKRKDGPGYRAVIYIGGKVVDSKTFSEFSTDSKNERAAILWHDTIRTDHLRRELRIRAPLALPIDFAELGRRFLLAREPRRKRTKSGYKSRLKNQLVPYFGRQLVRDITREQIVAWYTAACAGGKVQQANHDFDILRATLNFGVTVNQVDVNPAAGMKKEKAERKVRRRYRTAAEVAGWLAKVPPMTEEHGLILVAYGTGMRPHEMTAMRYEWIDWRTESVQVPAEVSKDREDRPIPMPGRTIDWLRQRGFEKGPVFTSRRNGCEGEPLEDLKMRTIGIREYLKLDADGKPLPEAEAKAAAAAFSLYDARHTYNSYQIEAGTPLADVMRAMGHDDEETNRIYQHLAPGTIQKMRAASNGFLGGAAPQVRGILARQGHAKK